MTLRPMAMPARVGGADASADRDPPGHPGGVRGDAREGRNHRRRVGRGGGAAPEGQPKQLARQPRRAQVGGPRAGTARDSQAAGTAVVGVARVEPLLGSGQRPEFACRRPASRRSRVAGSHGVEQRAAAGRVGTPRVAAAGVGIGAPSAAQVPRLHVVY